MQGYPQHASFEPNIQVPVSVSDSNMGSDEIADIPMHRSIRAHLARIRGATGTEPNEENKDDQGLQV